MSTHTSRSFRRLWSGHRLIHCPGTVATPNRTAIHRHMCSLSTKDRVSSAMRALAETLSTPHNVHTSSPGFTDSGLKVQLKHFKRYIDDGNSSEMAIQQLAEACAQQPGPAQRQIAHYIYTNLEESARIQFASACSAAAISKHCLQIQLECASGKLTPQDGLKQIFAVYSAENPNANPTNVTISSLPHLQWQGIAYQLFHQLSVMHDSVEQTVKAISTSDDNLTSAIEFCIHVCAYGGADLSGCIQLFEQLRQVYAIPTEECARAILSCANACEATASTMHNLLTVLNAAFAPNPVPPLCELELCIAAARLKDSPFALAVLHQLKKSAARNSATEAIELQAHHDMCFQLLVRAFAATNNFTEIIHISNLLLSSSVQWNGRVSLAVSEVLVHAVQHFTSNRLSLLLQKWLQRGVQVHHSALACIVPVFERASAIEAAREYGYSGPELAHLLTRAETSVEEWHYPSPFQIDAVTHATPDAPHTETQAAKRLHHTKPHLTAAQRLTVLKSILLMTHMPVEVLQQSHEEPPAGVCLVPEWHMPGYEAALSGWAELGDVKRTFMLFEALQIANCRITSAMITHTLKACERAGHPNRAAKTLEYACSEGILPHAEGLERTMKALAAVGDSSLTLNLLSRALRLGVLPTARAFEHALTAAAADGDEHSIKRVFELAQPYGALDRIFAEEEQGIFNFSGLSERAIAALLPQGLKRLRERVEAAAGAMPHELRIHFSKDQKSNITRLLVELQPPLFVSEVRRMAGVRQLCIPIEDLLAWMTEPLEEDVTLPMPQRRGYNVDMDSDSEEDDESQFQEWYQQWVQRRSNTSSTVIASHDSGEAIEREEIEVQSVESDSEDEISEETVAANFAELLAHQMQQREEIRRTNAQRERADSSDSNHLKQMSAETLRNNHDATTNMEAVEAGDEEDVDVFEFVRKYE